MNKQEIFDTVVTHLRKQGKRATRVSSYYGGDPTDTACAYRSSDGSSCAFGCLIQDSEYNPRFEGMSVVGVLRMDICPQSLLERLGISSNDLYSNGNVELMQYLQKTHDLYKVDEWEAQFKQAAELCGVVYTPLETP